MIRLALSRKTVALLAFCAGVSVSFFTLPLWVVLAISIEREGSRSDWFGFFGTILGTLFAVSATLYAGWLAYSAVQVQIRDYRLAARKTAFNALSEQVATVSTEIERLLLAEGFLRTFADPFPQGVVQTGYADILRQVRLKALDYVSASATNAPYGYGAIITTVMGRIQRLGDRMEERIDRGAGIQAVAGYYDTIVKDAINGIRGIAEQIKGDIPAHQRRLQRLADERDRFA